MKNIAECFDYKQSSSPKRHEKHRRCSIANNNHLKDTKNTTGVSIANNHHHLKDTKTAQVFRLQTIIIT